MKKFLLLAAGVVAISGMASASATACSSGSGYSAATLNTQGFQCELGDKIFSNFTFSGATTSDGGGAGVSFAGPSSSPYTSAYNVQVSGLTGGTLLSGFTLNYTVTVDTTLAALNYIKSFNSGINDSSTGNVVGISSNSAVLTGLGCTATSNDNNNTTVNTPCSSLNTLTLNVADTFTFTSSNGLNSVSNTFQEAVGSTTPEPTSFILMGAGLGLVGLLRRRSARQ